MRDVLGQNISVGDYVGRVHVYRGSCDVEVNLVVGFTNSSVRVLSVYKLREISLNNFKMENSKTNCVPTTRLIKISAEAAFKGLEMFEEQFDEVERFRNQLTA